MKVLNLWFGSRAFKFKKAIKSIVGIGKSWLVPRSAFKSPSCLTFKDYYGSNLAQVHRREGVRERRPSGKGLVSCPVRMKLCVNVIVSNALPFVEISRCYDLSS